jgi:hypothetical protein
MQKLQRQYLEDQMRVKKMTKLKLMEEKKKDLDSVN